MSDGLCGHTGTLRRNRLPRCGHPGSVNHPHNSISTQVSSDYYPPPPSLPSNLSSRLSTNHTTSSSISPTSAAFNNDLSPQNSIPGRLKPRFKLHIEAFNLRTLRQIGQQAPLAETSNLVHGCVLCL
ncbi:unnamed protein product [Heterobilharzia americana]|nr:unnamed protein product [Heterobilharzia americana]